MSTRIIIQHTAGSKINQVEQFPVEGETEISFGRDPTNTVAFDPQRDDMASRKHATIRAGGGETPRFVIADLGSSNGTFVNNERIQGERELFPGDTVELGGGGPRFVFDLQPRPPHLVGQTRMRPATASGGNGGGNGQSTRVTAVPTETTPTAPAKVGVGRETVQHMLAAERRSTSRTWMYALAGVLLVVAAVGGGLYYNSNRAAWLQAREQARALAAAQAAQAEALTAAQTAQAQALTAAQTTLANKIASESKATAQKIGMNPEEIAHRFGDATVQVFVTWRAIDKDTGRPVYHKIINIKGNELPCYIALPNGTIVRWLTSDDDNHNNRLVGGEGSGSGFVISGNGFIMTNKHVAAGWRVPYFAFSSTYETGKGLLFRMNDTKLHAELVDLAESEKGIDTLLSWVPEEGAIIWDHRAPIPLAARKNDISGENLELTVRFPGNPSAIEAKLVSASENADAAEIKIETGQSLATVNMADDNNVRVGQRVTVLGFPGFSTEIRALSTSIEGGQVHKHIDIVPEPTVTEGLISLLSPPPKQVGDVTTVGSMGDAYQLTVPTSHGNSGGPVFDTDGHVIALFTYGKSRETLTYAVPIKYARDLMQMQRVN